MTIFSIFCSIESPPLIFFLIEHQSPKWVQSRLPNQMQKENLLIFPNLSARCIGTWKYFLYYPKLWTEKKIILGSTGSRTSGVNLRRQILLNQRTLQTLDAVLVLGGSSLSAIYHRVFLKTIIWTLLFFLSSQSLAADLLILCTLRVRYSIEHWFYLVRQGPVLEFDEILREN